MKKDVFLGLRLKLSLSMMVCLAIMLTVLIGSFNIYLNSSILQSAHYFMEEIINAEGKKKSSAEKQPPLEEKKRSLKGALPVTPPEFAVRQSFVNRFFERIFRFRPIVFGFRDYYSAKVDKSGRQIALINPFVEHGLNEGIVPVINDIFKKIDRSKSEFCGKSGNFFFAVKESSYGYLLVILDRRSEINMSRQFALVSIAFSLIFLLIAFVFIWIYTSASIRPIREAFVKQKQFIADASHELKTPIAVISANIDVLEQDIKDNKWLGYIKAENYRMGNLVKDLLYLAKSDAGRQTIEIIPFDIVDAVACSLLPFESVAFEEGKSFSMNLPKTPLMVNGDEGKIKQVAIILLDNALKNSEKGAKISVNIMKDGNRCLLKVYNTGHGIAPKDIDKIFNRFYRADYSRARTTGGYGLGLTIAQNIAMDHHGKVTVQSEEGKYAEFTLNIPVDLKPFK